MRLGMFMMPVHPPGRQMWSTLAEDTEKSILADQLGFDELWMGEHFTATTEPFPSPLMFLAGLVHQTKRRGLAVVISDFYDPSGYEEALNVLRYNKFEPFVVQVIDPKEASPPLHGDLTLIDCETGEPREVTISAKLLAEYRAEHERYCKELESFCTSRAIPCFKTSTHVPFDELVLRIFRVGGFLR